LNANLKTPVEELGESLIMQNVVLSRVLEDEVFEDIQARIVKSFMDVIVLMELRNKTLGGYDVISLVDKKFGILLSSGTVYSQLYSLERNGLIEAHLNQRKREYALTIKGKETIRAILNIRDKIKVLMHTII